MRMSFVVFDTGIYSQYNYPDVAYGHGNKHNNSNNGNDNSIINK